MNKAVSDAIEFMEAREEVPYEQVDALIAELEATEAKLAAVRELHTKTYVSVDNEVWGHDPRCSECPDAYPCSTIAALDGTNA